MVLKSFANCVFEAPLLCLFLIAAFSIDVNSCRFRDFAVVNVLLLSDLHCNSLSCFSISIYLFLQ